MAPDVQKSVYTDAKRLQQVIKNLLSNAFKFTQQGNVSFTVKPAAFGWSTENENLSRAASVLEFSVSDTGIGIPPDKQQIIFEAFQQADGSTSRKFGGTGLGLAISREIARLLGGEIRLVSSPGNGQHLHALPAAELRASENTATARCLRRAKTARPGRMCFCRTTHPVILETPKLVNEVGDDRNCLEPGDPILLIVENDLSFARAAAGSRPRKGLQGTGHVARGDGAGDDRRVQARRDHSGYLPPGHRRLARDRPAQERHEHAAHPRLHHVDRDGPRPRCAIRCARGARQADQDPRDAGPASGYDSRVHQPARQRPGVDRLRAQPIRSELAESYRRGAVPASPRRPSGAGCTRDSC